MSDGLSAVADKSSGTLKYVLEIQAEIPFQTAEQV